MFSWLKGKKTPPPAPPREQPPEVMGLRLGGAFEIDPLKLKIWKGEVIFEAPKPIHLIQAVGQVQLDADTQVLRYYTDDDGFLQLVLEGGNTRDHVVDVKLFYFYDTKGVAGDHAWQDLLNTGISKPRYPLEQREFVPVWQDVSGISPPVAMTEKTWNDDGITRTDQFAMLYECCKDPFDEYLLVAGEEQIIDNRAEHAFVISTGVNVLPSDIQYVG